MKIKKFEELEIWKLALKITKEIYDVSAEVRFSKDFCLRDQIRRSIISVSANIVEGFEKNNNNEFIRYLKISKGSAGETRNHLYIALQVGHISEKQFQAINFDLLNLVDQIGKFISYLENLRKNGQFLKTR